MERWGSIAGLLCRLVDFSMVCGAKPWDFLSGSAERTLKTFSVRVCETDPDNPEEGE